MTRVRTWSRTAAVQLGVCVLLWSSAGPAVAATGTTTPTPPPGASAEPTVQPDEAPSGTTSPPADPTPSATPSPSSPGPTAPAPSAVDTARLPADPACHPARPADRGRLTFNPPQAPPGAPVLAVLTDLGRFPTQLVGGGSGEFFSFCFGSAQEPRLEPGTRGTPDLVVVALTVPPDATLGQRKVEVVFAAGTGGPTAPDDDRVWLVGDLEVTPGPVALRPRDPDTAPCGAATARPAPSGTLAVTPARTAADRTVRVRLADPPPRLVAPSERGGHYVVCLLGNAVVSPRVDLQGAAEQSPPLDLTVRVPAGTPPGTHEVRVLGLLNSGDGGWVVWRQAITVAGGPRVPVGGVDAGGGGLARPGRSDALPLVLLAAGLTVAVLVAQARARRRRRPFG